MTIAQHDSVRGEAAKTVKRAKTKESEIVASLGAFFLLVSLHLMEPWPWIALWMALAGGLLWFVASVVLARRDAVDVKVTPDRGKQNAIAEMPDGGQVVR